MARRELGDDEWALVEPLLPIGAYGPSPRRLRDQFEGVIWKFRSGGQWREVPGEFGPWSTVYDRFRWWRDAGVFQALMDAAIAEAARRGQVDLSLVGIDSTTARAHHDAAGMRVDEEVLAALGKAVAEGKGGRSRARKDQEGAESAAGADDLIRAERCQRRRRLRARLKAAALVRSRGGLTSKVHVAAERRCRPLSFVLMLGQAADSPQFVPVLGKVRVPGPVGRPRTRPDAVAGDEAYSSRANRAHPRKRGIKAVIPEKRDQAANRRKKGRRGGRSVTCDAELYRDRNTVERLIDKLKAWRGIATRSDKTPESYLAGLHLRGAVIWIRSLQPAP